MKKMTDEEIILAAESFATLVVLRNGPQLIDITNQLTDEECDYITDSAAKQWDKYWTTSNVKCAQHWVIWDKEQK